YNSTLDVPVEKRFYVGGENSVRGFTEKSINSILRRRDDTGKLESYVREGGDSFFSFQSEFHIPLFYGIDLLGFFDGGQAFATNGDFNPFDLRFGAGPGIRWNTPVGPLKVGYGFIIQRKRFNGRKEPVGSLYIGVGPL